LQALESLGVLIMMSNIAEQLLVAVLGIACGFLLNEINTIRKARNSILEQQLVDVYKPLIELLTADFLKVGELEAYSHVNEILMRSHHLFPSHLIDKIDIKNKTIKKGFAIRVNTDYYKLRKKLRYPPSLVKKIDAALISELEFDFNKSIDEPINRKIIQRERAVQPDFGNYKIKGNLALKSVKPQLH